jgi:glycosyltransferase involved in cell wall biosynthesis
MPAHPLVSVLMVSYNSSQFIREAIDSVLLQTYNHFELIICDDNSTDDSWNIISSYSDPRIRKLRNENNLGEYENRNSVVKQAAGEYLIFIDADDIIYRHGLDFMLQYAVAYSDCAMIISRPWDERIILPKRISSRDFYRFEYLDSGICGINFTKLLFKSVVIKTCRFPGKVKFGDLFIQYEIARNHTSLIIPDASTWWRRRAGQASEKLLKNRYLNLMHEMWIKLDKLNDKNCPLDVQEKRTAFSNLYSSYFRLLLRECFSLRLANAVNLLREYPIPKAYWSSLMKTQKRNFFDTYSGNHPLREETGSMVYNS